MRVLFVMLILALAGLLWASFAAARHIRTVRKRRRLARAAKTAAATAHRQALSATGQPLPSSDALRTLRRASPPPPPIVNYADWDDLSDLDPLSEVVYTLTPTTKRTPVSVQQIDGGLQDRLNSEAHANSIPREGGSSAGTGPNVLRSNRPLESMHPQALRTLRTHSLHVHG